jgi:hypothetical protein
MGAAFSFVCAHADEARDVQVRQHYCGAQYGKGGFHGRPDQGSPLSLFPPPPLQLLRALENVHYFFSG